MLTNKEAKRVACREVGPGGYKCRCCGPAPKGRPQFRRRLRQRLARLLRREVEG